MTVFLRDPLETTLKCQITIPQKDEFKPPGVLLDCRRVHRVLPSPHDQRNLPHNYEYSQFGVFDEVRIPRLEVQKRRRCGL